MVMRAEHYTNIEMEILFDTYIPLPGTHTHLPTGPSGFIGLIPPCPWGDLGGMPPGPSGCIGWRSPGTGTCGDKGAMPSCPSGFIGLTSPGLCSGMGGIGRTLTGPDGTCGAKGFVIVSTLGPGIGMGCHGFTRIGLSKTKK